VNNSVNSVPRGKAAKTRLAILSAAEQYFSRNGYAATRLEDIADSVGLTRAALFYHFRDKQTLYVAMLEEAFGSLVEHLDEALSSQGSITERIETGVDAMVNAIAARPTIARLVLRFVADIDEQPVKSIYSANERITRSYWELFEKGRASGELKPRHDDPFHIASALVGHTVFYLSALSTLIPYDEFNAYTAEHLEEHKQDVLHVARYLLGIEVKESE